MQRNDYPGFAGGSNLSRVFQQRSGNMEHNNEPYEGDKNLQQIDNFIDHNYEDIEQYANGGEEDNNGNSDYYYSEPQYGWRDDHVSLQHRTTSIHRNIGKFNNRNVEERRQWTSCAATMGRQPLDQHVEKIVNFMRQDNTLTEDSPEGEQQRREALRNMPQCLAVKKRVKRKFVSSISNTRTVGCFKLLKYQIAMSWTHLKSNMRDCLYTFELWYSSLKKIEGNFGSGVASYFKFLRWLFVINVAMTLVSFSFITIPQIVSSEKQNTSFNAMDLLTGAGYLNETALYYGFYSNTTVSGYNIAEAYSFTMISVYIATFILLSISMARSYRKSFIETQGGVQNIFAHKIFCSWEYSIASTKAASLKSKSIYNELKELISDLNRVKRKLSFCEKFRVAMLQISAHLFAVAIGLASGYLMFKLLENRDDVLLPAVVINVVMLVVPMLFRLFASYEDYKNPKVTLFVTLARTIFMEMAIIGVLIYYGLEENRTPYWCWENDFAQEVYRFILFDFFFSTLLMTLVDVIWYIAHKTTNSVDPPEFDIATNTLSLIYNQTLFWVGLYFAPLLGVMVVLKLFLTWYVRSFILMHCCQAPKKSWRAAQTESWFLIIVFLWSLVLLFVHGYHIFSLKSSTVCGPFTDNDGSILDLENAGVVVQFLLKPGVIAIILIGMAMGVYYLRAIANAQINMVYFLRHRLVLAAKDKEFLIDNINNITKGEFKYIKSDKREDLIDPTKLAPSVMRRNKPNINLNNPPDIVEYHSEGTDRHY